jgi:branched-chain amino acid transport system permease protein
VSPYAQSVFILALTYAVVTLGLQVTLSSGQFSVAHAALMGVGGYAGGIATVRWHTPFLFSLAFGALLGGLVGAVIAVILRRTSGMLLGTVTIAIGQAISIIARNTRALGGSQGYDGIPLRTTIWWAIGCAAAALLAVLGLRRSRVGMAMLANERSETVAGSLGINPMVVRLWGFAVGGGLAGLGGVLLAHNNGIIEPKDLSFSAEPLFFIFLMVGGVSSPWGAFFGAIGMWWFQELLRFGSSGSFLFLHQADRYWILGLVLVLVVLLRPRGLIVRRPLRWRRPAGPGDPARPPGIETGIRGSPAARAPEPASLPEPA